MSDNKFEEPDQIRDYAQHLDRRLDEALRTAPVYVENATAEYDTEAAKAAEVVVRAQEQLEKHLRRHRDILGGEPQYRPYYDSFDRIATAEEIAERINDEMSQAMAEEVDAGQRPQLDTPGHPGLAALGPRTPGHTTTAVTPPPPAPAPENTLGPGL
ncbi:hypothetical protein ACWDUL_21140 [Nocardia niigatensis]